MLHRQMGQQRALEGDQFDVRVVSQGGSVLRLSVRCFSGFCDRGVPAQQLGGIFSGKRLVHTRMDAPGADRASVSRVLLARRTAHRRQSVTWSATTRSHRHPARGTAQLSSKPVQHIRTNAMGRKSQNDRRRRHCILPAWSSWHLYANYVWRRTAECTKEAAGRDRGSWQRTIDHTILTQRVLRGSRSRARRA